MSEEKDRAKSTAKKDIESTEVIVISSERLIGENNYYIPEFYSGE